MCAVDVACVDSFCRVDLAHVETRCIHCVTTQAKGSHKNGGVEALIDHFNKRASSTASDFMAAFMEQKAEQVKLENEAKKLELDERRLRLKQLQDAQAAAAASDA